ncbi:hypothetical protein SBOR_3211 [Sclerotinia borealis F-4128]|uniref:Uncharacterized protein n=1 Tax=Sclerotinia borealis (strain F-4128) TaxID=1432307 RepID=W9CP42_SCLBF|nr:hypothetical protein SBOR_3211 [Sclerotinia borealis F-4128]
MSEDEDDVPRLLRDRRIKAVKDRFRREPTDYKPRSLKANNNPQVNELRAIEALPARSRRNLNDISPNGKKVYDLLTAFERGAVGALEEAGELLWAQIFAEPDFSQSPRREPTSNTRALARIASNANTEVRQKASKKPTKQSPAEEIISTNATSNAFAGSPQKSWMTTGVSVSPSPRRVSNSPTNKDRNNDSTSFECQSVAPSISFYSAQASHQNPIHTSASVNQVPGGSPDIYNSGVYTPWPLRSTSHENQYATLHSVQASGSFIPSVPERRDSAQGQMPRSDYDPRLGSDRTDRDPSLENLYDPAKSHYFATLRRNIPDLSSPSNSTPQHSAWEYPDSGMSSSGRHDEYPAAPPMIGNLSRFKNHTVHLSHPASSSRTVYDPSTPPFHPAISPKAQQLFISRKEEEENELARITSSIHRSLASLPDHHAHQQVASSSTVDLTPSSVIAAANTLANIPHTGRRTQLITPSSSTSQSSSSITPSMKQGQSRNNPFIIQDDMGFVRTFQPESDPNPASINPLPTTTSTDPTSFSTNPVVLP